MLEKFIKLFKSSNNIKLPVKSDFGNIWRQMLKNKEIPKFDTIVCFNYVQDEPQLFEYDGDINKIQNLANNYDLLKWLCDKRKEWFRQLIILKDVPATTLTFLLFDSNGDILGIAAIWTGYNAGVDFMSFNIPLSVIKDNSYSYDDLKKVSENNQKILSDMVMGDLETKTEIELNKTSDEKEWLNLAKEVLIKNNIISDARTCFAFTSNPETIQLLEYAGELDDVKKFINNTELLNHICGLCSDWKQYLAVTQNANQLIVTRVVWDLWGNIIGIMAIWWDYNEFPKIKGTDFLPFVIIHTSISKIKSFGKRLDLNSMEHKKLTEQRKQLIEDLVVNDGYIPHIIL